MAEQHVSRWRLPSERASHGDATAAAQPLANTPQVGALSSSVSLRYLDEFVRKLQCAPRLLEHQIFPDAKEITESMGLFNAVRRYLIQDPNEELLSGGAAGTSSSSDQQFADGIVVVGDGNTPRSAAMFAYRLKQWKCYSIDPAMKPCDSSNGWATIDNLVVIRNKIENVRIRLKRAVVVLIHAHVTLAQALSAVDAQQIVGVVTMPCCNWYGKQEELFGKPPDIVYDDFSILSDHRELRVWIDPRARGSPSTSFVRTTLLAVDHSATDVKGCVRKELVADYGSTSNSSEHQQQKGDADGKTEKKTKKPASAIHVVHDLLCKDTDANFADASKGPHARTATASETSASSSTASEMTPVQLDQAATQIAKDIGSNYKANVLVLGLRLDRRDPHERLVDLLFTKGYRNLYTLQAPYSSTPTQSNNETGSLVVDVVKISSPSSAVVARLRSIAIQCQSDDESSAGYQTVLEPLEHLDPSFEIDCVVDVLFLFRCLRDQPKRTCSKFFQQLVQLTKSMGGHLISVTSRKDWRKPEFLANERLGLVFTSTHISYDVNPSTSFFVYSCKTTTTTRAVQEEEGKEGGDEGKGTTTTESAMDPHAQKKHHALQLRELLEQDFSWYESTSSLAAIAAPAMLIKEAKALPVGSRVRVQGVVQHLRRFTTGPSFLSIAPSSSSSSSSSPSKSLFHDHLQVSLDPDRLSRWTLLSGGGHQLSLDALLRLLHKQDRIECVGVMDINAQRQPMLRLDAIRFVESEFQVYL